MTSSARSYLLESGAQSNPVKMVLEGMDHYTQAFLATVNQGNYADLPIMVAALKTVTRCIEESDLYKRSHSERMEKLILETIGHRFSSREVAIPKSVIDVLERSGDL